MGTRCQAATIHKDAHAPGLGQDTSVAADVQWGKSWGLVTTGDAVMQVTDKQSRVAAFSDQAVIALHKGVPKHAF